MRSLPSGLATALQSGAAGLATAWILTRTDGVKLGFTDHDQDLTVEGVACAAATGWTLGATNTELGASAGQAAATGALDSAALTEADIARGLYDKAGIETWRVLWSDPSQAVLVWKGSIARLVRDGQGFTAEIEGPLAALERAVGTTKWWRGQRLNGWRRCSPLRHIGYAAGPPSPLGADRCDKITTLPLAPGPQSPN